MTQAAQNGETWTMGVLDAIWCYPVKSLRAQAHERIRVLEDGLEGDRRGALFVTDEDRPRAGRPLRGKEHNLLHTVDDPQAAIELAEERGWTLALRDGSRFFDAKPVSLIVDLWVRDVEALVGRALDPLRWRPNLYVVGAPDFTSREEALVGHELRAGNDVRLRVVKSIVRCVTPNYDIETGVSEPAVLRQVVQQRNERVGIYCEVVAPGVVARGDTIAVSA